MTNHLGILAKYWQPGHVMTRLARSVGQRAASRLQREFLRALLARLASCGDCRVVAFTPADSRQRFVRLAETVGVAAQWRFELQSDGDLGDRIEALFGSSFGRGGERVVLLGADSPNLPRQWVNDAFRLLNEVDVVLGPTLDGGYYLVGARGRVPPIFADIPWGTREVFAATAARLDQCGCRYERLQSWYDVDRLDDLRQLDHDLNQLPASEDRLAALRETVADVLRTTT